MSGNQPERNSMMDLSDQTHRLLALLVPPFFVVQTVVLAFMPFQMSTSTLAIQIVGLGFIWAHSVYHVLGPQKYGKAICGAIR